MVRLDGMPGENRAYVKDVRVEVRGMRHDEDIQFGNRKRMGLS